jgi:hypothetical protein
MQRLDAEIAPFNMCLPDQVEDVKMVERVDHILEDSGALLGSFTSWWCRDCLEYRLVCPSIVARQHLDGVRGCHGILDN